MMDEYIYFDEVFEKPALTGQRISNREFDGCTFRDGEFSETVFDECTFIGCVFENCNLAMAKFTNTGMKGVHFKDSKVLGVRFDECADFLFSVSGSNSTFDYSWFNGKKMQKASFLKCSMKGVNFSRADLSGSDFGASTLQEAVFDETILNQADFSEALYYTIDPTLNQMKKARFSADGLAGLLDKYDIRII